MREIKFRAWNGEVMISPDYIARDGIAYWKENSIPTCSRDVMQFTGLRDKNGMEIYEGDIIDGFIYVGGYRTATIGAVEWDDEHAAYGLKNHGGMTLFHKHDRCSFEIIGNVHENPERLT